MLDHIAAPVKVSRHLLSARRIKASRIGLVGIVTIEDRDPKTVNALLSSALTSALQAILGFTNCLVDGDMPPNEVAITVGVGEMEELRNAAFGLRAKAWGLLPALVI